MSTLRIEAWLYDVAEQGVNAAPAGAGGDAVRALAATMKASGATDDDVDAQFKRLLDIAELGAQLGFRLGQPAFLDATYDDNGNMTDRGKWAYFNHPRIGIHSTVLVSALIDDPVTALGTLAAVELNPELGATRDEEGNIVSLPELDENGHLVFTNPGLHAFGMQLYGAVVQEFDRRVSNEEDPLSVVKELGSILVDAGETS